MRKSPRTLAIAGLSLVAGLGVMATAAPAFAAQDPILTEEQQRTLQAQVDAYEACLEGQGVTLPEKPADATLPEITDEQREAMHAAREACAEQRPDRPELSEEQQATLQAQREEHRACMEEQLSAAGITKPEKPAEGSTGQSGQTGERPQRPQLTDEQKAAVQAAHDACEDSEPNLGVEGIGPMGRGGPGGHGGPGGRMGPGGAQGGTQGGSQGTNQTASATV